MDSLHNKLNFNLVKNPNSRKEPFTSSKILKLVEKFVMCGIFVRICLDQKLVYYANCPFPDSSVS